ncbi:MAG: hypothetical protein AB7I41_02115 [Candidatus Sericytochromatia bacterium]
MQVNPYGPQPPVQGPGQRPGYPQPVVYRPNTPGYGTPDMYRPGMPPTGPVGAPGTAPAKPEYQYVAPKDVAFGLAGAAAGFFIGGPIGALIGGAIALFLSAIIRAVAHWKASKEQPPVQGPGQMPAAPNYPGQQQPGMPNQYQYQNQYNYQQNPNQRPDPRYQQQQYPPR